MIENLRSDQTMSSEHKALSEDEATELKRIVRHLVALERDRMLGYPRSELHRQPEIVVEDALRLLDELGENIDEIVNPEDQDALDLLTEE